MRKIAVFGNAGGGKSTLSKKLAQLTGLPLYTLDKIKFLTGGVEVPDAEYKQAHAAILATECWIIDGFGSLETLWPRLDQADTLVYLDLPLYIHFGLVTKRLLTGYFDPPGGWPERTPILQSSLSSYRVLWPCYKLLTPKYRTYVQQAQGSKNVYHLKSLRAVSQFLAQIEQTIRTS